MFNVSMGINRQFEDMCYKHTTFMYRTDVRMAYLNEDIVEYKQARDVFLGDLTSTEDETTKHVQQAPLQWLHPGRT